MMEAVRGRWGQGAIRSSRGAMAFAFLVGCIRAAAEGQESPTTTRTLVDAGQALSRPSFPQEGWILEAAQIRMRDGALLRADVYRPNGTDSFPVLLMRSPYSRRLREILEAVQYFVPRGYALVAVDVRGRFESSGRWVPIRHEEEDAYDCIDWIVGRHWCDGNVGALGMSYLGITSWYAAKSGHPNLNAVAPRLYPGDPLQCLPYNGGAFSLYTIHWAWLLEYMVGSTPDPPTDGWTFDSPWLRTLPLNRLDEVLKLETQDWYDEFLDHPPGAREYWEPMMSAGTYDRIDAAVLHLDGLWDMLSGGAVQNYEGMKAAGKDDQFLILGPWSHAISDRVGRLNFGPHASVDLNPILLRFFDRYLKGIDNGIDQGDPVAHFVMGTAQQMRNPWSGARDWPIPGTVWTDLYLSSEGDARRRDGDGRLGRTLVADAPADVFQYDPKNPPRTFGDLSTFVTESIDKSTRNADLEDSLDVLDYTSPRLAGPVELTGNFTVTLSVATSAEDTDFVANILRVDAKGGRTCFATGIQRLRYRFGPWFDDPVPPGRVVTVVIDCGQASIRLEEGERLRVEVCSSNYPAYARHLNTLERDDGPTRVVVARNEVHHDATDASFVTLPVVPRSDAPGLRFEGE